MSGRRRCPALLGAATTGVALALLVGPSLAVAEPGNPGSPRYGPGADGAGDPYFPLAGNGGIDVLHYRPRPRLHARTARTCARSRVASTASPRSTSSRRKTSTASTSTCAGSPRRG